MLCVCQAWRIFEIGGYLTDSKSTHAEIMEMRVADTRIIERYVGVSRFFRKISSLCKRGGHGTSLCSAPQKFQYMQRGYHEPFVLLVLKGMVQIVASKQQFARKMERYNSLQRLDQFRVVVVLNKVTLIVSIFLS